MIDIEQFKDVGALALLVGLLIQWWKPKIRKDRIPYVAVAASILAAFGVGLSLGLIQQPKDILTLVINGLVAGLLAVGGYESTIDKLKRG